MNRKRGLLTLAAKILLLGVTSVALLHAQGPASDKSPGLEVQGVVLDQWTGEPLAGVNVYLAPAPGLKAGGETVYALRFSTTGRDGAFFLRAERPGVYRVLAELPDPASGPFAVFSASVVMGLDKEHPEAQVRILLPRRGSITGRLVDDDTGKPLSKTLVRVYQAVYSRGQRLAIRGGNWTANEDGRFVVPRLMPGEYLIGTAFSLVPDDRPPPSSGEDDAKLAETGYAPAYWPGGLGLDAALPVSVAPQVPVDLGELRLRKQLMYRMRVSLAGVECEQDDAVLVHLDATQDLWRTSNDQVARLPCGKGFLTRPLPAGSYRIEVAVGGADRERLRWGSASFQVADQSSEVTVALSPGANLEGTITPVEGSTPPALKQVEVRLRSTGSTGLYGEAGNGVDAQGRFRLMNIPPLGQQLTVSGLPPSHHVKEVRYGGHVLRDRLVVFNVYAPSPDLEIVVDDKAAVLSGTVTDGGGAVRQPRLALASWPLNALDPYRSILTTVGGDNGRYQFPGLAPGDYRVLAVPEGMEAKLEQTAVLLRLLADAEQVTLHEKAARILNLTLRRP